MAMASGAPRPGSVAARLGIGAARAPRAEAMAPAATSWASGTSMAGASRSSGGWPSMAGGRLVQMASCGGVMAVRDESFDRFFISIDCIHVRGDLVYVRPQGQKGLSRSQIHVYILEKKENTYNVKKINSATFGGLFLRRGRFGVSKLRSAMSRVSNM